ncbi:uncharacterized protein GGS22DRAFT_198125 [Annulohypoxylon maeteangense]|uniref:uncharacterized protein n=1 Tax=Annulohypoxylon maeteangense TaxID=1927788 RepID=UPI002008C783|nr:uncharacterized protein GGS22DRAFT_198125 [Annulohypoxylon maeteangense]KAI0888352.1 hypothetical protein GGS22DRAFT_198125 [Annulohypoxylon maeteangense]
MSINLITMNDTYNPLLDTLNDAKQLVGWVDSPNVRGTIDIIWSCVLVLVTSLWTVIHLNLPAKDDRWIRVIARKLRWGFMAILGPDLLTLIAANQWESARRSVAQIKDLAGSKEWTLKHAFYADSGGFHLQPAEGPSFPINASTLHFLVSRQYIKLPEISSEEIWDKSKADVFAKSFTLLQTGWIAIQSIARAIQGLSISPMELFTLAFLVSTASSYFFWWHKPQDVKIPIVIECKYSIATILAENGVLDTRYANTPLDFVANSTRFYERRRTFQNFDLERRGQDQSADRIPLQRIPDDDFLLSLPFSLVYLIAIPAVIHSSIHLAGWNFAYPTPTEKLLWRISSVVLAAGSSINVGVTRILAVLGYEGEYNLALVWVNTNRRQAGDSSNRVFSAFADTFLTLSTLVLVIVRCFIITEAIISLRKLPADAFETPNWTNFIPHI